jgi:metal-responsive CopG/Arc/MetJ family transcriptional regulator
MDKGNRPKDAAKELRNERVHVLLTKAELDELDAWRRENGISNRNEAVRFLIKRGMK